MINLDNYNDEIRKWGAGFVNLTRSTAKNLGVQHRADSPSKTDSLTKLKDKYRLDADAINKVSVGLPRTLMYTVKGAGKGIGGSKGSRWTNAKGVKKKTNPSSLGKIGSGSRHIRDFIGQALDSPDGIEKLADIAAEGIGSSVIENVYIK